MQDVALLPCTRNKDGKVPSYHSRIKKAYSASLNSPCAYSPARLNFLAASTTISILSDFLSVPAAQFSTMARDARRTLSGPYKNSTCHASYMICSPSLSQLPPHGLFCWTWSSRCPSVSFFLDGLFMKFLPLHMSLLLLPHGPNSSGNKRP